MTMYGPTRTTLATNAQRSYHFEEGSPRDASAAFTYLYAGTSACSLAKLHPSLDDLAIAEARRREFVARVKYNTVISSDER
mmetsp:Transcript_684/g.2367  ORF Transcript_684/g.2367 Transcript_684/m.2367 type:complete len:81 (+) Transcript_684:105-347(+)